MSTELKSRSKGYNLTRFAKGGPGNMGLAIGRGWNQPSLNTDLVEIEEMFRTGDFSRLDLLGLLDETVELLKVDIAQFSITKGNGMEAY